MTLEGMLLRCEEQIDSSHDPMEIKFATWDVTMTPVTQHIEPKADCDEEFQRTSRDRKEDEEQRRRGHGTDMSMYQVDTVSEPYGQTCIHRNENTRLPR